MKTIVIAPHPDDEVLGAGGTLLRRKQEGHEVAWIIVTEMNEKRGWTDEQKAIRETEIQKVQEAFQFNSVYRLGFPTTQLDELPMGDLVAKISDAIRDFQPQEVLLPHANDPHTDHQMVYRAAMSSTKAFRYPFIQRILSYQVLSETDFNLDPVNRFHPNVFINIDGFLEKKIEIMKIYKSELKAFPFPRSVEAIKSQARLNGSISGYQAAETFQLLRERV